MGSFPFARRYSGNRGFFLFLRVLRCFSSPGLPSITYEFSYGYLGITPDGFPHSDIHGSKPAFGSPWLFADRCVLLRLLVPRHSPYALSSLIFVLHLVFYLAKLWCSPPGYSYPFPTTSLFLLLCIVQFSRCILRIWSLKTKQCELKSKQYSESLPESRDPGLFGTCCSAIP